MKLSGWAKHPIVNTQLHKPKGIAEILKLIKFKGVIARGNGRSYGDSAIGSYHTIEMSSFNKIISFNEDSGQIIVESGTLLSDIIETFLPKGWFPCVTPGSKFVTVGGMIASDVHGKNHHKVGSFGKFVDWIDIINANGEIVRCSQKENSELFNFTIGGMGLTGIIIKAAIRLKKIKTSWIKQKIIAAENIDKVIEIFESTSNVEYSVAWIDCLQKEKNIGRSLIMLGEHADINDLPIKFQKKPFDYPKKYKIKIPFSFPNWFLNHQAVSLFNKFYFFRNKNKTNEQLVDFDSYFYPLDKIIGWNKIYGKKGFAQFQCVIPISNSKIALNELLLTISKSNCSSFLSVLKKFGTQNSFFSFPFEGYTLALDFPISKKTLNLMTQLDEITLKYKGRFYLTKDSRMSKENFLKSDIRTDDFIKYRKLTGSFDIFNSSQSNRLGI